MRIEYMINKYYSQCAQDEFVDKILNHQTTGFFIDIGASHPIQSNNSYFFESIGWSGLCFDQIDYNDELTDGRFKIKNPCEFSKFSDIRKSKLILGDARCHDYNKLFVEENVPSIIDYLSIDVDEYTLTVLEKIPFQSHQYKVITIEHDWYRFGDSLRIEQRRILNDAGYYLLCADVDGACDNKTFFEDWWINPEFVNLETVHYLKCTRTCCNVIVKRLSIGY